MNYKIIYTDDLPEWVGGTCSYPWYGIFGTGTCTIKIRKKYMRDVGIHNHEIEHARQYHDNILHTLRYKYIAKYRLECELQAYRMQVLAYGYKDISQALWIVEALCEKYNLPYDYKYLSDRVKELL